MDGTGSKSSPASGDNVAAYTIAKLADGNCWMTSNLKLGLSTSQAIEVVTNETGVAKSTKWTPTGSGGNNAEEPINNNTVCTGNGDNKQCWYTWYAAVAGSGSSNDQKDTDAPNSICPAGWRLPSNYTVSQTKSYGALIETYYGFTTIKQGNYISQIELIPMDFTRSGGYTGGNYGGGSFGMYWSATTAYNYSSESGSYVMYYEKNNTNPQASNAKHYGRSVRCLAV